MKMKISWLRLAALALLALMLCCGAAMAETYGPFVYKINDDQTVSITAYAEVAETVTVPEEIDGMPVVSVSFKSPQSHPLLYKSLTEVTLPQSVVRLDSMAFESLYNLSKVNGLDHLEAVGDAALSRTSITEAVFGKSLIWLNNCALMYSNVTRVVMPDNVVLGPSVFRECFFLEKIQLLQTARSMRSAAVRCTVTT